MRLTRAELFFERHFDPDSRPSERTRIRWLQQKVVPSKKVGGQWFVDEEKWLADGDPLVERVLAGEA